MINDYNTFCFCHVRSLNKLDVIDAMRYSTFVKLILLNRVSRSFIYVPTKKLTPRTGGGISKMKFYHMI